MISFNILNNLAICLCFRYWNLLMLVQVNKEVFLQEGKGILFQIAHKNNENEN